MLATSRRNFLIGQFVMAIFGLAAWNLCIFLQDVKVFSGYVSLIARVQLVAILLFGTGLFNFCSSFPENRINRWHIVTAIITAAFGGGLLFTRSISDAVLDTGGIRYIDGKAFGLMALYICLQAVLIVIFLMGAWKRHPELRNQIRFFFAGVTTFVLIGSLFNMALPAMGKYDFLIIGRLSSTVAALLFFYAIAKHEFLDVTVIINKQVAWAVTVALLCGLSLFVHQLARDYPRLELMATLVAAAVAALAAHPLQNFLLTSAKRKFIKGWYEPEEVFHQLGSFITQEGSREAIFRKTLKTLDEVFELEETLSIVAMRDQVRLTGYRVQEQLKKVATGEALILSCKDKHHALALDELSEEGQEQLRGLLPRLRDRAVILPFHSPEFLEGVLVLGAKSSGAPYTASDMTFFNNLINYLTPLLYRLTPIETLERLYNENQKKLHDAEIQLLRAQKIESIVHATRQCHHEIRTPLNIIRLGLGRIKTLEDLENYKGVAREEIDHAIEIVEETLAVSDVNRPTARVFVAVNIGDVVNRCLRLVDRSRYQVTLDVQDTLTVRGIFSDLQVVLTNLIHNAMEAMPDGGSMSFTAQRAGNNVLIRVEDTGEGIPAENRSRVWEPYFSGKGAAIGNSTAGRGWGLTIVNRIINEHAGTIALDSEVGVGTRFVITLPVWSVPAEASNAVPAAARA
ncbi:MAG TPA: ATP-binding protein [Candidatus Acidoferrum sp.]|nr:ATP-binding protein [Candidatus Acidoferrum sp.]